MKTVTLVSKQDCHLCDIAKDVVLKAQRLSPFEIRERKIVPGDADFDEYRDHVPVVLIDGRVAFRHKVSVRQLLDRLNDGQ